MATTPHITIRGQINSRYEMLRAGYKLLGANRCKACGAAIEWWLTNKGNKLPFNPIADDEAQTETHWQTCPHADSFRKKARAESGQPKGPAVTEPSYKPLAKPVDQAAEMKREIEAMRRKYNLRAMIMLHDCGYIYSYRLGIVGEDVRSEIIAAANAIRTAVTQGGR